jgi:hypothetical protein
MKRIALESSEQKAESIAAFEHVLAGLVDIPMY